MTMDTDALIRSLTDQLEPVRPISGPWIRTLTWLALAIPSILFLVLVKSPRADLASKLSDPEFVLEQVAALATGAAAAAAAFASVIPGYRPKLAALPVVPLAVWLGSLGHGCVQDWLRLGPHGLALRSDWSCIIAIAKEPEATFYWWLDVGGSSEEFARRLLGHGIVVAPGSFFGDAGEGYVRLALVPNQEQCERAATILREVL